MKKTILLSILIAAIFFSCKKYEEGPCISLRSPEKRLIGHYTITAYTIDGVDSLSLFSDSLSTKAEFVRYFRYSDITFSINGRRNDGQFATMNCSCGLVDNNSILHFIGCGSNTIGTGPFKDNIRNINWEILKLTNKDLKFKTLYNNKEYVVVMEKI